jgi:septum formation protein
VIALEKRIYLASRSPRRRELLKQIGVSFELLLLRGDPNRGADVDEARRPGESAADYVIRIAGMKAQCGWLRVTQRLIPDHPVLAADTAVAIDGIILGKPANKEDAVAMLKNLSGKQHDVFTAVAMCRRDHADVRLSSSKVAFRELSEDEIRRYVATGESCDKAGAYAIQGRAASFVSQLCGSYSGVMGLPLFETEQLLARFGYTVL